MGSLGKLKLNDSQRVMQDDEMKAVIGGYIIAIEFDRNIYKFFVIIKRNQWIQSICRLYMLHVKTGRL